MSERIETAETKDLVDVADANRSRETTGTVAESLLTKMTEDKQRQVMADPVLGQIIREKKAKDPTEKKQDVTAGTGDLVDVAAANKSRETTATVAESLLDKMTPDKQKEVMADKVLGQIIREKKAKKPAEKTLDATAA